MSRGAGGGSIAEVLDRAASGDTIQLPGGHYQENIVVDVPVVLTEPGEGKIRGGYVGNVVHITAPGRRRSKVSTSPRPVLI